MATNFSRLDKGTLFNLKRRVTILEADYQAVTENVTWLIGQIVPLLDEIKFLMKEDKNAAREKNSRRTAANKKAPRH